MEEDLELKVSPTISIQDGGYKCTIECEERTYRFEFKSPISHVAQLANTKKR